MARFNTTRHQTKPQVALATSPIATVSSTPDTRTALGAPGWTRTPQAELFLLSTGALLDGKDHVHESGFDHDSRFANLVRTTTKEDPAWTADLLAWLRGPGNMRTAPLVGAAEFTATRLAAGQPGLSRQVVNSVLQRPDEPDELLAYWTAHYGRRIPKPLKRGIADATRRLYNERSLLKYDSASKAFRFGDTLNLTHPTPLELVGVQRWETDFSTGVECPRPEKKRLGSAWMHPSLAERKPQLFTYYCVCGWYHYTRTPQETPVRHPEKRVKVRRRIVTPSPQGELFQYALDRRHHPGSITEIPNGLSVIARNKALRSLNNPDAWLDAQTLRDAGITWEDALSAVGDKVDKAKLWEALIPSMGIMAQLRNLRNFDQAGVSDKVAQQVMARLTDPDEIAKSRQFPFRFLSAYRATSEAGSLRWAYPLEQALTHSLVNVPSLNGRTLILVDRSPSMFPANQYYQKKTPTEMSRADQAAVFGSALAVRAENATLVEFGGTSKVIGFDKSSTILKLVEQFSEISYTDIPAAIQAHYANHDRVIILTDEQTQAGYLVDHRRGAWSREYVSIDSLIPLNVPVFMWNFAGYTASAMESGRNARFTLGGLTDSAFRLIPILENGAAGVWPWQLDSQDQ